MITANTPGYTYGGEDVAQSPITLEELRLLQRTIGFTEEDVGYLRLVGEVFATQVDQYLEAWHAYQDTLPHLNPYRDGPGGESLPEYRAASWKRFRQWILDTCQRPFDQDWLNYQHEIGLRHSRDKKNQTDGVQSAPFVSLRYILALAYPFATTANPFLARSGQPAPVIEKMQQAWAKAVFLQLILWSCPFVKEGEF